MRVFGTDRGRVRVGSVCLRTSIKKVSEQPAIWINSDKKPEGLVEKQRQG